MAILDADKIGFLRSTTSLIQTAGRAARNAEGRVIMYADRMSDAMRETIEETSARRAVQMRYNAEHGITPKTIRKAVEDILERDREDEIQGQKDDIRILEAGYNVLDSTQRKKLIKELERQMFEAAKNLEFEKAAVLRDEIENIRNKNYR